jgi:hypothetical protein
VFRCCEKDFQTKESYESHQIAKHSDKNLVPEFKGLTLEINSGPDYCHICGQRHHGKLIPEAEL